MTGDTYASPWKARRDGLRDQIAKLGTALIRDAVEQWALTTTASIRQKRRSPRMVAWACSSSTSTGRSTRDHEFHAVDGAGDGDFNYVVSGYGSPATFTIVALLRAAPTRWDPVSRSSRSDFNMSLPLQGPSRLRAAVQVVKEYIDHWADTIRGGQCRPAPTGVDRGPTPARL